MVFHLGRLKVLVMGPTCVCMVLHACNCGTMEQYAGCEYALAKIDIIGSMLVGSMLVGSMLVGKVCTVGLLMHSWNACQNAPIGACSSQCHESPPISRHCTWINLGLKTGHALASVLGTTCLASQNILSPIRESEKSLSVYNLLQYQLLSSISYCPIEIEIAHPSIQACARM